MSNSSSHLLRHLTLLSETLRVELSKTRYSQSKVSDVSIKSLLESLLLPHKFSESTVDISESELRLKVRDFTLCCAALAAASDSTYEQLSWIPNSLSGEANSGMNELSEAYAAAFSPKEMMRIGELELELKFVPNEKRLIVELITEILPLLKNRIKESSLDKSIDADITAASAGVPVVYAIVAAYQLRWLVTQIGYPHLGKICPLVIPCALTALDHWSPEVKAQGMITFIHLAKNVNAAEIGWYEDVILDACYQNIASADEIWHYVVEMSVLLATLTQRCDPRNLWYEKLLNEMFNHLERQPRDKERRVAWLKYIDPLFSSLGLILLAHFRRLFPLFFRWMHADDDETVLLVLERIKSVIILTWVRKSPYIDRLIDELVTLHKEAALRIAREDIRASVLRILSLIQQSKCLQFQAAWDKHKDDPDLATLHKLISECALGNPLAAAALDQRAVLNLPERATSKAI